MGKLKEFSNNDTAFNPATDLVNPGWFDFRPASGATAIIDGGVAVEAITGTVAGNAPDIGAYEHGDSVYWIPGQRMEKASFPIVPDKAENVPLNRDVLMWRPAYTATTHQIYFGTGQDAVKNAGAKSPEYKGEFKGEGNVFTLPKLAAGQTYWWRVDAVMPDGSVVPGDLWGFTTTACK